MGYIPKPINTGSIILPDEIIRLSETLAKNTHEVWAKGRLDEGWAYGETRDDAKKVHPGLVEYEELSEGEKGYDRRTSIETLKLIMALGYKIVK